MDADSDTGTPVLTKTTVRATAKAEAKAERAAQKAKAKEERQKAKTLAEMAERKLLKGLSVSLNAQAKSATFACGGEVMFKGEDIADEVDRVDGEDGAKQETEASGGFKTEDAKTDEQQAGGASSMAKPTNTPIIEARKFPGIDEIQVRFGPRGEGITAVFNKQGIPEDSLKHLLNACRPASFGRGGETVHDEQYRKAGKLNKSEFATSFCPYEAGIVDVIAQLLVPQLKHEKHARSVRAELYKLNVYSAPNGKFKPHVDTPLSKDQIGSLVVALPAAHEGGELAVRHAGEEVIFDWSAPNEGRRKSVKWAAFYSDCEHEVFDVTAGSRVTLTYNLFITRGAGHLAGGPSALDATQLPLYDKLLGALDNPGFLRRGRVLAIWLTHAYAHTHKDLNFLPDSLKGADMSLYNTAQALGLKCRIVPVMSLPNYGDEQPTHIYEPTLRTFNGGASGDFTLDEYGPYWGYEMPESKITWLNAADEKREGRKGKNKDDDGQKSNEVKHKEVQMAFMTYGNEPGIAIDYSRAAMLIRIPPFRERLAGTEPPASIWEGVKRDPGYYDHSEDYSEDEDDYEDESEDYGENDDESEDSDCMDEN